MFLSITGIGNRIIEINQMSTHFDTNFVTYAVNHVNEDHSDALLSIFKYTYNKSRVEMVTLISYNTDKMIVNAFDYSGKSQRFDISFVRPLQSAKEFRPVLIEMLKFAKENLK